MESNTITLSFVENLWLRKAVVAAGHTFLVYDYALTLSDEIEYIWNAPWTMVKATFLVNRYGNLIGQTFVRLEESGLLASSQLFCENFNLFSSLFLILSAESTHILVLMRAWAIWGCRKRVAAVLIGIYLAYIVVLLGSTAAGANTGNFHRFQNLEFSGICVGIIPKYVWLVYVARQIHVEAGLIILCLFRAQIASLWKYSQIFQHLYPSALLHLLFRDVSVFFLISIFNDAFIVACWTAFANDPRYFLAKGLALPILAVGGQRVVLNLRGLQTRTYSTRDLSREVDRQMDAFRSTGPHREDGWGMPAVLEGVSIADQRNETDGGDSVELIEILSDAQDRLGVAHSERRSVAVNG
ncbi:hypothetical protein HYDPIDRAFT_27445 [Hydnomerulius pinastri MD-312]|nr:hypothetical protein HYDPIDRAFT_27445 [Hydnomerulius pinastri MD-312]